MNRELPNAQAKFRKGRGTRDQIANICWILEKATELGKKKIYFLFTMLKPLTVWITTNWKILKEMGIPKHLACLLRNLYAGQETTVRIGHGTMDRFKIGKGVRQGCTLSPCLFSLEHISCEMPGCMKHKLDKIAERNITNLRYADDSSFRAESEEELKSFSVKVKQETVQAGLKLNIQEGGAKMAEE